MMKTMKNKVQDIDSLQLEIARLKRQARAQEKVLGDRFDYLRRKYPSIMLHQVLPFGENANDKIAGGLGFAGNLALNWFLRKNGLNIDGLLEKAFSWIAEKASKWFSKSQEADGDNIPQY